MRRATQLGIAVLFLALAVGVLALWQQRTKDKEDEIERQVEDAPGRDTVITFACMDYQREEYEKLARDFEQANPDIHVQFISADEAAGVKREGNVMTIGDNDFEGLSTAADTFVWREAREPAEWSYILNLQPFVNDPASHWAADDFYPSTLDHLCWEDDLYGLPAEVIHLMFFYDKELFDQAGLAYPKIGWTWDDFIEAAVQLTVREGEQVQRYGFVDQFFYGIETLMYQHGVRLWDDANLPKPLFNQPRVADVLRRYTDLTLTYGVMPAPEPNSNLMTSSLIQGGQAAMWTDVSFGFDNRGLGVDLGLAPFPEDVGAANPSYVQGFFISAGTAHPDAAWRWLTFLSENYRPWGAGNLPGRRSVGEQLSWWKGLDEETRAVYEYILAHPAPARNPLNKPLRDAAHEVLAGQASIQEALETAQAKALELQAELAAAAPATPQRVAAPPPTRYEAETSIKFTPPFDSERSLYEKLAASFNESHPDIGVQIVSAGYDIAERAADSDCFGGIYSIYPEMRQYVRSLEPFADTDADFDLADYYAPALDSVKHDGELLALPYELDALLVYVNPGRFAEAGLALPEPGWSIEDFLDAAVALSGGEQYGFTTTEGAYGDLLFVLERLGARLLDDAFEYPRPNFDDPTVVAALERYVELYRAQPLTPATPSTQAGWPDHSISGTHPDRVESGQVAMWVDYVYKHTFAPPLSFEVGVAPLPLGARASTEFSVRAYYISSSASAPQACWEWLTFLTGQPEVVELLPARRSVLASPRWQERVSQAALPAYQATLEYSDTPLLGLRWSIGYSYPWLDEAFQATLTGHEAEPALRQAQAQAEELWACLETTWETSGHEAWEICARQVDSDYPLP